jgi:thioesterase domain-containing protein/acyl carrier protein
MPAPSELRDFLRDKLPEYMVPQHFVELDAIPLLPNGKLDRAGLPAASAHLISGKHTLKPRDAREQQLWRLWRDVLGVDHFGIEDNFFDLGGHSMLAVRLIAKIREAFGLEIALPRLFQYPTISEFMAVLDAPGQAEEDTLVALQPKGQRLPLFCLCGIQLYQALASEFSPDRPVYGIFVNDELQLVQGTACNQEQQLDVPELAAKYLAVIRKRQPVGPYHLAGLSFGGILAYEIAQQLLQQGEDVGLLVILDSNLPGAARDKLRFRVARKLKKLALGLAFRTTPVAEKSAEPPAEASRARSSTAGCDAYYLDAIRGYSAAPYPRKAIFVEASLAGEYTSYGWRRLLPEGRFFSIPTDHLGLLKPPATRKLAGLIKRQLD